MSTVRSTPLALAILLLTASMAGCASTEGPANEPLVDEMGKQLGEAVRLLRVGAHLDAPVGLTPLPDGSGRLLVTEQPGRIALLDGRVIEDVDEHRVTRIADLSDRIASGGERGLLGVAPHPSWPEDPRVFLHYTDRDGNTVLSAFDLEEHPLRVDPGSERVLLRVEQPYANHNGGQLRFGPDGLLLMGLGDGGAGGDPHDHGQDPHTLLGTILRIDIDDTGDGTYGIPADNPFADGTGGAPEVFVYGLRNPWRFSYDLDTQDLWIADVGQNEREEVTRLPSSAAGGANLGWNAYEGSQRFAGAPVQDVVMPSAEYEHAGRHCSVVGGHVYRGTAVPSWEGMYVFGDYCSGWMWGMRQERSASAEEADEVRYQMGKLFETPMAISAFGQDLDGEVYVVDHNGAVWRFAAR